MVYYRDPGSFPENREKLGRVLGPIANEGNEMAQAVLNAKGKVIPRQTIRKLLKNEIHSETEKRKRSLFDDLILKRLEDSTHEPDKSAAPDYGHTQTMSKPLQSNYLTTTILLMASSVCLKNKLLIS